ncbi:MAG: nitrate/nitrite transporter NrtS [Gammaproteobacteria bacterium]|nr:nitrate/nitrite transporter NrtS [Gammaproteobacteria bacterium]
MKEFLIIGCRIQICRRAVLVALVVGTLLNLINHYDVALGAVVDIEKAMQIVLTYLVPYFVSTHGQVVATIGDRNA